MTPLGGGGHVARARAFPRWHHREVLPGAGRTTAHGEWFADARDGGRQMEVSWHTRERLVVISLWHDRTCRATFRLPLEEAPRAIAALAGALGEAAGGGAPPPAAARPRLSSLLLDKVRSRLRREPAEIVSLSRHPRGPLH